MKKIPRAKKAGRKTASALIENIHLLYQDNTALNFLKGLVPPLLKELSRREILKYKEKEKRRNHVNTRT